MINRGPIPDPAFPTFLDVTGTSKASTQVEVVQWREPGSAMYETARVHADRTLSGARADEYRRGTERHFFTVTIGAGPSAGGEVTVYLSPAQFAALRDAVNGEVKSHYANEVGV